MERTNTPCYVTFDVESTMRGPGKDSSAYIPDNKTLVRGMMWENHPLYENKSNPDEFRIAGFSSLHSEYCALILCGHNLRFDLAYEAKFMKLPIRELVRDATIWDTQIAHYILSSQRDLWPSLDKALERYTEAEVGRKSHFLEVHLASSPDATTETCDPYKLKAYCLQDVRVTHDLAKAQMAEAFRVGKFPLIVAMGDALKAIAEMEQNGMPVDLKAVSDGVEEQTSVANSAAVAFCGRLGVLETFKVTALDLDETCTAFCNSSSVLSYVLFGGPAPTFKYKSGKTPRGFKWSTLDLANVTSNLCSEVGFKPGDYSEKGKNGLWCVDEGVLRKLHTNVGVLPTTLMCVLLYDLTAIVLRFRTANKLITTYFGAVPKYIRANNLIHPNINQTATVTGRLSSSAPNFQNMTDDGGVKDIYVAPEGRVFLEWDYKQLEVIGLAFLSRCPALIKAVRDGVDIHNKVGERVLGRVPNSKERKDIKRLVFAMIYGSGAKGLSESSGKPVEFCQAVMDAFDAEFPGVKIWNRERYRNLKAVIKTFGYTDKDKVIETSCTGRTFAYDVYRNVTGKGVEYAPSWTQVCNYPCQGFATGDLVPLMLGGLWEYVREEELDVLFHNTVHDSILFSVPDDHSTTDVARELRMFLERPQDLLYRVFNIDNFDLPLTGEMKIGKSWGSMEPIVW